MEGPKIAKLGELLKDFLGPNKTITGHDTTRLTAAGENYGSLMLALKVYIKNGQKNEILEAVAKLPPPGEFIQRMFNIPVTFKNEIDFYRVIVPELNVFLKERGIPRDYLDCYPEYYGARLNRTNEEYADDDAVLLLENLKISGYEVVDRNTGFDLKTSRLVLKALAKFHAIPVALKLKKPETFQQIKALFTAYKVFDMDAAMQDGVIEKNRKIVEEIEDCKQYVRRVVDGMKTNNQFYLHPKNSPLFVREPWATIIHTDAWVNNFMVQFTKGEPTNCKIVDFQLGEYGSPARDVIFFLYSSVQIPVVQKYYDDLVSLYHQNFVDILEKLGCDITAFSLQTFHKEIETVAKESEFFHSMIMLEPVFATKDSIKELDQYKEEDMTRDKEIPEKHKERAAFIVKEFIRKNFI